MRITFIIIMRIIYRHAGFKANAGLYIENPSINICRPDGCDESTDGNYI